MCPCNVTGYLHRVFCLPPASQHADILQPDRALQTLSKVMQPYNLFACYHFRIPIQIIFFMCKCSIAIKTRTQQTGQ